jgi:phage terminase large subunit-like protein
MDAGSVKFRGLFGGTGSGKTRAGIAEDVYWCLRNPGIVGYIFEPTYKMIDRIIVPTLNVLLGAPFWQNPIIESFNRGRMNIQFFNGSTLWMVSLDDPEQAEGGNLDFAHADEARLVKPEAKWETAWRVIQRRLRGSAGDKYPIGAWVTTTPNQPGSALYNFFENPKTKSPEAKVYRIHLDDNQEHLPPGFIEGIKREHSGALYKRFVEGLFAGDIEATFAFDYAEHVAKYALPQFGDIVYGVDFGWTDPTCIVAVMFDNDRRAFVVDEMYENRLSDQDIADKCHEMIDKWGDGIFWCDPASPDTIDFLRRERVRVKPGNRRRDEGIREIGGRLQDAGDGRHRLYVSDDCINLIDELQSYNMDRKGHDHAVDALRYCLLGGKRKRETIWGLGSLDKRRGPW